MQMDSQMDPSLTPYRVIADRCVDVEIKTWPKKYPAKKRGEVSFYGAGILPVCQNPDPDSPNECLLLSIRYMKGKKEENRWYDFGGKKFEGEFPTRCACRHFAKKTYGMFGVEAPHLELSNSEVDDLSELLHSPTGQAPANLPLMIRSSEEWAKEQVEGDMVFFHAEIQYFIYIVQVPYIRASLLDSVSKKIDGKRRFQWFTCPEFCQEPLARRLHVDALINEVSVSFGKRFKNKVEEGNRSTYTIKWLEEAESETKVDEE